MPGVCEPSVSWTSHTIPRCLRARLSTPKAQQRSTPNEAAAQPEPREAIRTTRSKPGAALELAETEAVVRQQSRESRRTTKRSSPPQSAQQAARSVPPAKPQPAPTATRAAAQRGGGKKFFRYPMPHFSNGPPGDHPPTPHPQFLGPVGPPNPFKVPAQPPVPSIWVWEHTCYLYSKSKA